MKLPPGFRTKDKNDVYRLHKSIYGLKKSPRCWFEKLSTSFLDYGFIQSVSDYSLFTMNTSKKRLHVLVYVDYLIIAGNSPTFIAMFKDYMSSCFHMKDLGILKYFLGIEVARNSTSMYLCQRKYTLDIISDTGLLGARPCTFLFEQNHGLTLVESPTMTDPRSIDV